MKISLKNLKKVEQLSRDQLKYVLGGTEAESYLCKCDHHAGSWNSATSVISSNFCRDSEGYMPGPVTCTKK